MAYPALNRTVALAPVEGGYLGYDEAEDRLHELNATGALIAELCNGARSVAQIGALAAPFMPDGQADSVSPWIDAAVAAGLLVWAEMPPQATRTLSASELLNLARRLWEKGHLGAALRCAKQVTTATPKDVDAWYFLSWSARLAGQRGLSRMACEQYLQYCPKDAAILHQLTALRDETPPPRASNECVVRTFGGFAGQYDEKMRVNLGYQAPERIEEALEEAIGDQGGLAILDLGCGTGLAGTGLKKRASRLVGVDLSPEMTEVASQRDIYDRLEVAEITEWLGRCNEIYDLIVACDCLVYFGDLRELVALAAARLRAGGLLTFTVECGETNPFRLTDSGRYTHHAGHIRDAAAATGLQVVALREGFLRYEFGAEVTGWVALLKKPERG